MASDRLTEKLSIFLSANELAKVHTFNLTDAFAVLYSHDPTSNVMVKIGTTEIIRDNRSPSWVKMFSVDYLFETIQHMVVRIYQEEDSHPTSDVSRHTLIGESKFRLSDVMRARAQKLLKEVEHHSRGYQGSLTIRAESTAHIRDIFEVTFAGQNLANKDGFFDVSDPYLVISRQNEDSSWTQVWKSAIIDNNLNPKWQPVKLPMSLLCNGDMKRPLRIDIFDHDDYSDDDPMGSVLTSVQGMITSNGSPFLVIEEAKKGKRGYTNSGTLTCTNCKIEQHPLFSDFIMGGCELSLMVAIDFTASNGEFDDPLSLHHIDPQGVKKNQYEEAILSIGNIIESYDSDKKFPLYGFGARFRDEKGGFAVVQHCFPVANGKFEVNGIDGIMEAYHNCRKNIAMSGPTLFEPLLEHATTHTIAAECTQMNQKYQVLLILTDGVINDMDATKLALIKVIINSCSYPLPFKNKTIILVCERSNVSHYYRCRQ